MANQECQPGGYLFEAYHDGSIDPEKIDIFNTAVGAFAYSLVAQNVRTATQPDDEVIKSRALELVIDGYTHNGEVGTRNHEEGLAVEILDEPRKPIFDSSSELQADYFYHNQLLGDEHIDAFSDIARGKSHPKTVILHFPHASAQTIYGHESGLPLYLRIKPQARDTRHPQRVFAVPLTKVCRLESDEGKTIYVPHHRTIQYIPRKGQLIDSSFIATSYSTSR